jgi:hypothetical protein
MIKVCSQARHGLRRILLAAGLAGLCQLWLMPTHVAAQDRRGATEELRTLYEEDQADRRFERPPSDEEWEAISARDTQRQARVYELLKGDRLSVAEDFYYAGMILQHRDTAEDVLLAHILATAAGFLGDERGFWLSAASLDRYLLRTRRPQRLGTQYVKASAEDPFSIDSRQAWSHGPYIRWLPDSIRGVFGVESLADQDERVRSMNGREDGA